MIKNFIFFYKDISPIYLIDFSISENFVFNELEKFKDEEIKANIDYLIRKALYFRYKKLYSFLKKKKFEIFQRTDDEKILSGIEEDELLKKYSLV